MIYKPTKGALYETEHPGNATRSAKDVECLFFSPPSAPQTRRRWKTKKRHDWWMQPLEVKCKTPSFCCIGGVTNGTLPSCFSLPSMTTAASRAEPWEASPGAGRISRQVRGKDNGTAALSAYNTQPATHRRVAAARIAGKAEKTHTMHNGVASECRDSSQTNPGASGCSPLAWQLRSQWKGAWGQLRSAAANGRMRNAALPLSADGNVRVAAAATPRRRRRC